MIDAERRQEILKAEEAIRQLASELGRTKETAALTEMARDGLREAKGELEQTRESLKRAVLQLTKAAEAYASNALAVSEKAQAAIRATEDNAGRTAQAFHSAAGRLETIASELQQTPKSLERAIESEFTRLLAELKVQFQQNQETTAGLRQHQNQVTSEIHAQVSKLEETQQATNARVEKLLRIVLLVSGSALLAALGGLLL